MVQHIIAQPVTGDGVVDIVGFIGHPVITELLGDTAPAHGDCGSHSI